MGEKERSSEKAVTAMGSPPQRVSLKFIPPIAEFTIKGASGINIMNVDLLNSFRENVEKLKQIDFLKAAIISSGNADGFAAGADMRELRSLDTMNSVDFSSLGQSMFSLMNTMEILFIAAVDGYCIGGGFDMALACDIVVASQSAYFQHPGVSRGFITGFGGNHRFNRTSGRKKSVAAMIQGTKLDYQESNRCRLSIDREGMAQNPNATAGKSMGTYNVLDSAREIASEVSLLSNQQISLIKSALCASRRSSTHSRLLVEMRSSYLYSISAMRGDPRS